MKNILLLGDSIRQNYQPATTELFAGKANVYAPADNCRFTGYTLLSLDSWLSNLPAPDIIQWNNGIWDLTYFNGENHPFTSLEDYLRDTKRICDRLKKTGATLIFALTTPLHPVKQVKNKSNDDICRYNEAVAEMLRGEGVIINDLNTPVWADYERNISDDGCHLSEAGAALCARLNYEIMLPYVERREVLLLGDSIAGNYKDAVVAEMGLRARVSKPTENGRFTAYTLNTLRSWATLFPKPEIVHWNNGIWDSGYYYGEEDSFTPLDEYVRNLGRIHHALKFLFGEEVKVIFALTTPMVDDKRRADICRYNDAARAKMAELGVAVHDLYSVIAADMPRYICADGCHLSEDGKAAAGRAVAEAITKQF